MSILKVARMGHPVLRQTARSITPSDLKDPMMQRLINDMIDTMHEYHGVGLAAPQIHEGLRIFVAAIAPQEEEPLSPGEMVVCHHRKGRVVAVERHLVP